ncbi:hypothetical protein V8G54_035034 [Vigna mungo]|uniref:Uncharacterized protein n=1 Tax=Vigna mungo TaxID=3915 RepID=A0AAQ3MED1_VIGMU
MPEFYEREHSKKEKSKNKSKQRSKIKKNKRNMMREEETKGRNAREQQLLNILNQEPEERNKDTKEANFSKLQQEKDYDISHQLLRAKTNYRCSNALEEIVLEEYGSLHMFVFDPGGIKTSFSYSMGPAWPSCFNLHSNVAAISGYSPRGQGEVLGPKKYNGIMLMGMKLIRTIEEGAYMLEGGLHLSLERIGAFGQWEVQTPEDLQS